MIPTLHPGPRYMLALVGGALLFAPVAGAQQASHPLTGAQKIANAMRAAPSTVASQATILDWPASDTAQSPVLRQGTNGWVCYPDFPASEGNDPVCLDKSWQEFMAAYAGHKPPQVTSIGVSYMIAPGGGKASNTDPYATAPTADNQWGHHEPHVMIVVPDVAALQGLPTTRQDGAPYVMWAGTPYAHIMVPLAANAPAAPPARH